MVCRDTKQEAYLQAVFARQKPPDVARCGAFDLECYLCM